MRRACKVLRRPAEGREEVGQVRLQRAQHQYLQALGHRAIAAGAVFGHDSRAAAAQPPRRVEDRGRERRRQKHVADTLELHRRDEHGATFDAVQLPLSLWELVYRSGNGGEVSWPRSEFPSNCTLISPPLFLLETPLFPGKFPSEIISFVDFISQETTESPGTMCTLKIKIMYNC